MSTETPVAVRPQITVLPQSNWLTLELGHLRDQTTGTGRLRRAVKLLTAEVLRSAMDTLPITTRTVKTPLQLPARAAIWSKQVAVVQVWRAGFFMVQPVLDEFPEAKIGCVGTRRNEETADPEGYYCNLPKNLDRYVTLVVDPMLATGGSACDAIRRAKASGADDIRFLCILAAPEGVLTINQEHPEVAVFAAALDDGLNDKKYIKPGAGDLGDRLCGTVA